MSKLLRSNSFIILFVTFILTGCDLVIMAAVEVTDYYEEFEKNAANENQDLNASNTDPNSGEVNSSNTTEQLLNPVVKPWEGPWVRLRQDLIHDPDNPIFELLQEPGEPLHKLPGAEGGNLIDWELARLSGMIEPRETLDPDYQTETLDLDVFLDTNGSLPVVRFPHSTHTEWLGCNSCHDELFAMKTGETKFTMVDILNERACGACHGKVAFPINDCFRCHDTSHARYKKLIQINKEKLRREIERSNAG